VIALETTARSAKATAIADALRQCGVGGPEAAVLDQPVRDQVARAAGQRSPSDLTWTLVVGLLVRWEAGE
jgi:hypothetical protein